MLTDLTLLSHRYTMQATMRWPETPGRHGTGALLWLRLFLVLLEHNMLTVMFLPIAGLLHYGAQRRDILHIPCSSGLPDGRLDQAVGKS